MPASRPVSMHHHGRAVRGVAVAHHQQFVRAVAGGPQFAELEQQIALVVHLGVVDRDPSLRSMWTVMYSLSDSRSDRARGSRAAAFCGSGTGIGTVESMAFIDVTRKKISRKKTMSTMAVMSIRSSKSIFIAGRTSDASGSGLCLERRGGDDRRGSFTP